MSFTKAEDAVMYVAETSCCGLKIHDPREGGQPAHGRRKGLDDHLPANESYPACRILRYWEFRAFRQISRSEIMKEKA